MKFSAVVTRYFSFTGLSQNNPKWEGSEEVSCPQHRSHPLLQLSLAGIKHGDPFLLLLSCLGGLQCGGKGA